MTNLRLLRITIDKESRLHLLEGLECLSDKLRHLYWDSFPLECLPPTFCGEWLVKLTMKYSKLRKLWDGIQRLDNLMILDLGYSKDLLAIPDLSRAPNLKVVYLSYCESLRQLHPSIFSIPKLLELHLDGCKKIESLKNDIHLKSLQILDLLDSSSLAECSVTSEEMELSLSGAVVQGFSSGLPLTECSQINTSSLWFILDGTRSLKNLNLSRCCSLEILPNNIQNNSMLEILKLNRCSKLKSLPELPASLQTLELNECPKLKSLPKLPASLQILELNECSKLKSLPKLPASLQTLEVNECRKLKSLPKLPVSLQCLEARNCIHLETNSIQRSLIENLSTSNRNLPTHPSELFFFPGGEVPTEFNFQTAKGSIVIPPIPKYGLCGFIICIILSEEAGLIMYSEIFCSIYQHTREFDQHRMQCCTEGLISDHVLLDYKSCDNSYWVKIGRATESDDYNLSFKFICEEGRGMRTEWIKSCGVIPVYDLKHSFALDGRISGVEIVEIQSNTQLYDDSDDIKVLDDCHGHSKFDINESQPQKIGAENEDDQHQLNIPHTENMEELNDTSPCSCSIGLLLKYILEESKRLFLKPR